MWATNQTTRTICLKALNDIIEDVFHNEDPLAGLRGPILSAGIVSIMASTTAVQEFYQGSPSSLINGLTLVPGATGWLTRMSEELVNGDGHDALPIFHVIRSTVGFIITRAVADANLLERIGQALVSKDIRLQTCAVDCLYILLTRPLHSKDPMSGPIATLFEPAALSTISQVWQEAAANLKFDKHGTLNDDEVYTMLKKLSETIIALACSKLGFTHEQQPNDVDLANVLDLVMLTWKHPSLVISGMSNSFWCSLLRDQELCTHAHVTERLPALLSDAAQRFIKFEEAKLDMMVNSDLQRYLDADIESSAEMSAFCGNYRRFVFDIVRMIVFLRPADACTWIRQNVRDYFAKQYVAPPQGQFCTRSSPMYLLVESHFLLIEAGLRGILRFRETVLLRSVPNGGEPQNPSTRETYNRDRETLKALMEEAVNWCDELTQMSFTDPLMLGKHVSIMVAFAAFLDARSDLLFRILEKIIQISTFYYPENVADVIMTTIRDLRGRCGNELLRLASTLPDQLWTVYNELEQSVNSILQRDNVSEGEQTTFNALLLIVSQRTKLASKEERTEQFNKIVGRACQAWNQVNLTQSFSSFDSFLGMLEVNKVEQHFRARGILQPGQLDAMPLDEQGRALLKQMRGGRKWFWPVRASRKFVDASLDVPAHMREFQRELWAEPIKALVPNVLNLLTRINDYHDESKWRHLSPEMQLIHSQSILERFWLHGVSKITRDQFLEMSTKSTESHRELVHSVGHFLRKTREYCLVALGTYSLLGAPFYNVDGVAGAVLEALYGNTAGMSLHIWSTSVTAALRHVVLNCPTTHYENVLSVILPAWMQIMLQKLHAEWAKLMKRGALQTKEEEETGGDAEEDEDLSDEMMEESLLRHLSNAVVKLLGDVVVPPITTMRVDRSVPVGAGRTAMSDWILRHKESVGPLMLLLSFLLTVHDTRTSIQAAKTLKAIIPPFMDDPELHRFVCHEVFSATIRCIHDSYFVSIQLDLLNLLSHIYFLALGKSTLPREILLSIPQMRGDVGAVRVLEEKLGEAKTDRARRSLMYELLSNHEIVGHEAYGRGEQGLGLASAAALGGGMAIRRGVKLGADVTTKEIIRKFSESVSLQQQRDGLTNGGGQDVMQRDEDTGVGQLFDQ